MSLLLNALKKAALDKQKREQQFADGSLPQDIIETDKPGSDETAQPEDAPQNGSYMEYDPDFMATEACDDEQKSQASPKQDKLFIENDETSWDEQINQHEFDIDDIDPDLKFDEEEFEEREDISEQDNNNASPENAKQALQLELTGTEITSETPIPGSDDSPTISPHQNANKQQQEQTKECANVEDDAAQAEENVPQVLEQENNAKESSHIEKEAAKENAANKIGEQSALSSDEMIDIAPSEGRPETAIALERQQTVKKLLKHSEAAVKNSQRKRTILLSLLATLVTSITGAFYYHIATTESSSSLTLAPPRSINQPLMITPFTPSEELDLATALATEITLLTEIDLLLRAEEKQRLLAAKTPSRSRAITTLKNTPPTSAHRDNHSMEQPVAADSSRTIDTEDKQTILVGENDNTSSPFNQAISEGFSAWQSGEWKTAEEAYNRARAIDPNHRDAILGAAAVAVQLGQQQKALRLYQKRIARAPRDEFALAGIIGLGRLSASDATMESELNVLLQSYPQAAHLHFLKGTIHAGRKQWQAAQRAFFEAWRLDYSKPDYVFNLAVAMDHLEQRSQALEFYSRAQELASNQAVNFSTLELHARIAELKHQLALGN